MVNILLTAGWTESSDGYDLICPADRREEIIPAIANSLINWRVTSNQSRTYSPQATLAIAVAGNANAIVGSIRADLNEGSERLTATPVIEEIDGVNLFVAPACKGYVADVVASNNALEQAERHIIELLRGFDYEYSSVATAV